MFIKNNILESSDCLEFQYIKDNSIPDKELMEVKNIEFLKADSLYIKGDDIDKFERKYGEVFRKTKTPDGSDKFSPFGINLYTINQVKEIFSFIKSMNGDKILLDWLKEAIDKNFRIYILGV